MFVTYAIRGAAAPPVRARFDSALLLYYLLFLNN